MKAKVRPCEEADTWWPGVLFVVGAVLYLGYCLWQGWDAPVPPPDPADNASTCKLKSLQTSNAAFMEPARAYLLCEDGRVFAESWHGWKRLK